MTRGKCFRSKINTLHSSLLGSSKADARSVCSALLPETPEAPEANDHRGDNTAFAADVYSYGVLLLVLVANKNVLTTSTLGTERGQQVHIVDEVCITS